MKQYARLAVAVVVMAPVIATTHPSPVAAQVEAATSQCVVVPGASVGDVAVVNITPARAIGNGYGSLRASGTTPVYTRPVEDQYSSVNFAPNTPPNPNLALVEVGPEGRICYDGAVSDHDVVLDLAAIIPAGGIEPVGPVRLIDTRDSLFVEPGTSRCLAVPDAVAGDVAVINITPVRALGSGFGALRARGSVPVAERAAENQYSSVNFAAGTSANPNLSFVEVGTAGEICYDGAVSRHDLILDLAGIVPASVVDPIDPKRIVDTRDNVALVPGATVCAAVSGASAGDVAVVNITPVRAQGSGFGALRAGGTTPVFDRPVTEQYSSVNFAAGTPPNPNLAVVEVGADGEICYDGAVARHDVVLDLSAVLPGDAIASITPVRLLDTRGPSGGFRVEVEISYTNSNPVYATFPDYAPFGLGEVHNGYTKGARDVSDDAVKIGDAVGTIVDNGDGTLSGTGFIENRSSNIAGRSANLTSGDVNYDYFYDGFGILCPESPIDVQPGMYVFESRIPVVFSGRVETFVNGVTFYEVDMAIGIGATPGDAGAVPELDVLIDTLDTCEAPMNDCAGDTGCGDGDFDTYAKVVAERDVFVTEHLKINQAFIENGVIETDLGFELGSRFSTPASNDPTIQLAIELG